MWLKVSFLSLKNVFSISLIERLVSNYKTLRQDEEIQPVFVVDFGQFWDHLSNGTLPSVQLLVEVKAKRTLVLQYGRLLQKFQIFPVPSFDMTLALCRVL